MDCQCQIASHKQYSRSQKTNQHALAMSLLMKECTACCGQGPSSYTPIVQALTMLSDSEKAKGMGYFDRYLTITL